jgi:HSP20 family protein
MSLLARRDSKYNAPVSRLQNDLNQLFDSFFSGGLGTWPSADGAAPRFAPSIHVSENKEAVLVRAEVPGLEAKDLDIHIEDDVLVLKGEKKAEKSEENDNCHYSEVSYGSFVRRVGLPARVDSERAEANLEKGVLKLKLPKAAGAVTKQIKVK